MRARWAVRSASDRRGSNADAVQVYGRNSRRPKNRKDRLDRGHLKRGSAPHCFSRPRGGNEAYPAPDPSPL